MENPKSYKLKLSNARQIACISNSKEEFKRPGPGMDLHILSNASLVVGHDGNITKVGSAEQIETAFKDCKFDRVVDCSKYCILPGFVDAHTHALFLGDRSKEFDMKLHGKNYVDIYNEGLGIRFTTNSIRQGKLDELVTHLDKYLQKMLRLGTTTVEVKSGYGLDTENEVKMLKAIKIVADKYKGKLDVVATYCGAHAIPKGKTEAEQTDDVINHQIPQIDRLTKTGEVNPVFIDVFCQKNFFEGESTIKILEAGKKVGMVPSFHGDQLNNLQSGTIGAKVGARAISHLEYLSSQSIRQMVEHNIAAVLLPTTQNIEKLPVPPIKQMREKGVILALGTDFCPNAFCYSMQLTMHFACVNYRLTPQQALTAGTLNSAYALKRSDRVGSVEEGKQADLVLVQQPAWQYVMYSFGDSSVAKVIKRGQIVLE